MLHCIIGANAMDRIVKCPGSLKPGFGSLAEHDRRQAKHKSYTKNSIENNGATHFGEIVDDLAKSYIYYARTNNHRKLRYAKPEHECDEHYYKPAEKYKDFILNVARKFDLIFLDPGYDVSKYIDNLHNCEFRVAMNPDVVLMNNSRSGLAFVSDLSTAQGNERNKMFQVLCCAIGLVECYPNITEVICNVYNARTEELQFSKFTKDELEAYRDDIILPALQRVRNALDDNAKNIEEYRSRNSWCGRYCVFGPKEENSCKACHCGKMVENEVPIHLHFFLDLADDNDRAAYRNLYTTK